MGYFLEGKSKFQDEIDKLVASQNVALKANEQALNSQNTVNRIIEKDKMEKENLSASISNKNSIQEKVNSLINDTREINTDNQLLNKILLRKKEIIESIYRLIKKGINDACDPFFYTTGVNNQLVFRIDLTGAFDISIAEMYLTEKLNEQANFIENSEYIVNIRKVEYVSKGLNVYSNDEHYLLEIIFKMKTKDKNQKL